jgi:hypothetical protein
MAGEWALRAAVEEWREDFVTASMRATRVDAVDGSASGNGHGPV